MTRNEYLKELKYELRNLTIEEQEEALTYYRNYFEDADNDEEVIREFGTPSELAQTIVSKFASVPQTTPQNSRHSAENLNDIYDSDAIRSLDISLGTAEVVMTAGEKFAIDYRGLSTGDIRCELSPFGTLSIENTRKFPNVNLDNHDKKKKIIEHPRILIKIPNNIHLDTLRLHVEAGSFVTKDLSFSVSHSQIDVSAGNLVLDNVDSGSSNIHCGMGNIKFIGSLHRYVKIDCGMGNVSLSLTGDPAEYSICGNVGLGSVHFNDIKRSGVGTIECKGKKASHFDVNCGMGSINIKMKKQGD